MDALLAAAARLIAERGVDRVSMTDIATASDMSKAAVYRYFPNKAALVRALAVDAQIRDRAWLEQRLQAGGDPMTTLLRVFREYCGLMTEDPYRAQLRAAINADVELAELDHQEACEVARTVADYLGDAARESGAKLEMQILVALYLFDGMLALAERTPEERDMVVDTYLDMVRSLFV
ncbi:MAG: helix-turn-helix domain-containing protein [Myxococcota bacterium]